MICSVCKEVFDPRFLSQVVEHEHNDLEFDKEYFGTILTSPEIMKGERDDKNRTS